MTPKIRIAGLLAATALVGAAPPAETAYDIVIRGGRLQMEGGSTVQCTCGWDAGQQALASVQGTVAFNFNFYAGSLSGALHPYLYGETLRDLGTLPFSNAVFGVGSQTFSGTFATNLAGPNAFSGQFTGPAGEELIGKWAFPLISPYDGSLQSASGAMIAKRP